MGNSNNLHIKDSILESDIVYKFIPRHLDTVSKQYLIEICRHLEIEKDDDKLKFETLYVPYKYIIGAVNTQLPIMVPMDILQSPRDS